MKKRLFSYISIAILILTFCFTGHCFSQVTLSEKQEESLFVAKKAYEDGFYEVAIGLFEKFLKNYPDSPKASEAQLYIGQSFFQQNKFAEALAKFESLLNQPQAKTVQDSANYWIAEVNFRVNNFSKAGLYYKKIIDDFPNSSYFAAANYSYAWCLFQDHKVQEALKYFNIVEEKFAKEPFAKEASFKIIECLYNLKDYAALKKKLENYLKTFAQDKTKLPYLYFYLAESKYYLQDLESALLDYNQAISSTSDEKIKSLSRLGCGWSYLKLKKYEEAKGVFSKIQIDNLEASSKDTFLLGNAILLSETKKYEEASKFYSDLAQSTTDPLVLIQSYLGQADAYYNLGKFSEAIKYYKSAQEVNLKDVSWEIVDKLHYGLAWSYLKEGFFKEAIDEFQKVARLSEDKIVKVSALCQIGDAYQDAGNFDKAIEAYDKVLKEYPDNLYSDYVQYQLGVVLLKSGNYNGASLAFSVLKKNFPDSKLLDDASYSLGLSYFQREDYNASKQIFTSFINEFKDSYLKRQAMYLLATSCYNLGQFNDAIDIFKSIVKQFPEDKELIQKAEYEIADCLYRMGNEKEALARFNVLRTKYADSSFTAETVWWLAEYYYRHNDFELSSRYFLSIIKDFPQSNLIPNAYYAIASICEQEKKYDLAIENFQKVSKFSKSELSATAQVAIADIYAKTEKLEKAIKVYSASLEEFPNLSVLIYPKLGDVYKKMNNLNKALENYKKALDLSPLREQAGILFKIAEIEESLSKPVEAIENYLKSTYLNPEDKELQAKSFLRIAAIYENKNDFMHAKEAYKKVIDLAIDESKYAQERLDLINSK